MMKLNEILYIFISVFLHSSAASDDCKTKFLARQINYSDMSTMDFYFTSSNISSAIECASLCVQSEYCQTAVFNQLLQTCSECYDWMVDCRTHKERYESFSSNDSRLVLIACIDLCEPEEYRSNRITNLGTNDKLYSSTRTNISKDLSNDRSLSSHTLSRGSSGLEDRKNRPRYAYRFIFHRLKAQNALNNSSSIPSQTNETADDSHIFEVSTPTPEEASTINDQMSNVTNEQKPSQKTERDEEHDPDDRHGERAFPYLEREKHPNSKKKSMDPKEGEGDGKGFLNKFIIEGINGDLKNTGNNKSRSDKWKSWKATISEADRCFNMVPNQFLLNAGYQAFSNVSRDQCRCLCAKTWSAKWSSKKCKSFQYNAKRECLLNKDDHFGKYDLVYDRTAEYHFLNCSRPEFPSLAFVRCFDDGNGSHGENNVMEDFNKFSNSFISSIPNDPTLSMSYYCKLLNWKRFSNCNKKPVKSSKKSPLNFDANTSTFPPTTTSPTTTAFVATSTESTSTTQIQTTIEQKLSSSTTQESTTSTSEVTLPLLSTIFTYNFTPVSTTESSTTSAETSAAITTDSSTQATSTATTEIIVEMNAPKKDTVDRMNGTETPESELPAKTFKSCFRVVDGYIIKSVAGALESDVSLEECQCFCAMSRNLTRHSFQCASTTYYHNERDCVLNVDTAHGHSNAGDHDNGYRKQLNVSYSKMLCTSEESIGLIPNELRDNNCRLESSTTSLTTVATTTRSNTPERYSDECFVELPDFVLEGTALAVEDNVTIEQCKCFCIDAYRRYGVECQSVQFYFGSKTCLINKDNRISNPDRFNYLPSSGTKHSYFDYQCAANDNMLATYKANVCSAILPAVPDVNIPDNDTTTEKNDQSMTDRTDNPLSTPDSTDAVSEPSSTPEVTTPSYTEAISTSTTERTRKDDSYEGEEPEDGTDDFASSKTTKRALDLSSAELATEESTPLTPSATVTAQDSAKIKAENGSTSDASESTGSQRSESDSVSTTESTPHEASSTYAPAGPCTYSAIYQRSFKGIKLLSRTLVASPVECFSGCYHEKCRSANLIMFGGVLQYCELYKDSLIDYRTPDVLGFDNNAVYFDGIECEGIES